MSQLKYDKFSYTSNGTTVTITRELDGLFIVVSSAPPSMHCNSDLKLSSTAGYINADKLEKWLKMPRPISKGDTVVREDTTDNLKFTVLATMNGAAWLKCNATANMNNVCPIASLRKVEG